jgi:HemY protein
MKALFWIVAIFALAVGVVAIARYNTGYLLLVLPPYRIELSLNLLLVVLLVTFTAGYFLVRMVAGALRLPAQVRAYRVARRRQKAQTTLLDALQEFFSGRYARAETAAASSIELGEHAALCAVLAARAAHELRAFERRDVYLAQAAKFATDDDLARVVTEVELLLDQRRFQEALALLKTVPKKHTAALRLELKAQQLAKNWEQVLALVDQLEQRDVFDAEQARQIRYHAQAENLKRKALDGRALEEAWQQVPARQKKETRVAAAAAQCFIALGGCERAYQIIEASLDEIWDSDLIGLYAECAGDALRRIECAEAWL